MWCKGRAGEVALRLQSAELLSKSHLTGTLNLFLDSCLHQALSMSKRSFLFLRKHLPCLVMFLLKAGKTLISKLKKYCSVSSSVYCSFLSLLSVILPVIYTDLSNHTLSNLGQKAQCTGLHQCGEELRNGQLPKTMAAFFSRRQVCYEQSHENSLSLYLNDTLNCPS